MSVDDVWDRAEKRQERHESDLHSRIAELEAEVEHYKWLATHDAGRNLHAEMCYWDRDAAHIAALERRWEKHQCSATPQGSIQEQMDRLWGADHG